jgi:outer membrane receptor protein involved in Fe transport
MATSTLPSTLAGVALYLPIVTTLVATLFAVELFRRHAAKGGSHLLWWAIGMVTYGLGTLTEAWTTLAGWNPVVFRCWYVVGALLGGYPLAQGSIYLLSRKRFADLSARIVPAIIGLAAIAVFLSPLDLTLAEPHRLSGRVLVWSWVRMVSPFINLYAVVFLVGGAAASALRWRHVDSRHRAIGNALIAFGAILPGIGGSFTRFGHVEVLYVTELLGLLLIFAGYRRCIGSPEPVARFRPAAVAAAMLALLVAGPASAQDAAQPATPSGESAATAEPHASTVPETLDQEAVEASFFDSVTVTATGTERPVFEIATPVTVLPAEQFARQQPDNAATLLRDQPGVDVQGVGPNQARPIIRGQRGLRVLFLEDGLRLNNARRQTDFGEITGLVDLDGVQTVEVVRGPASVLYGSDAIGGVLNLVPRRPSIMAGKSFTGQVEGRYGSAADNIRGAASVAARSGRFEGQLGASERRSSDYDAPSGDFGTIHLRDSSPVRDSGLDDSSLWGNFVYRINDSQSLRLRAQRYRADQTGFGFVDPQAFDGDTSTLIRILYPFQNFDRYTLSYEGSALGLPVADTVDAKGYWQSNDRALVNDIDIDIGPLGPGFPHSSVAIDTLNHTTLDTWGLRLEAIKGLGTQHLLTWGSETYRDDSTNTDDSRTTTTLRFPFPPFEMAIPTRDTVANAPNAQNTSLGFFAQDEWTPHNRLRLTAGARWQKVSTRAESTPGWNNISGLDFSDDKLVGALTATYQITDTLNALASYGTAFRAPNIIERLFNGPTPEGDGYQILNPGLQSESSDNWDLGIKYRRQDAFMELVGYRSEISDGVVQYFLAPAEIAALPADVQAAITASHARFVVQQRNAERLRYQGLELATGYRAPFGLTVGGNVSLVDGQRIDSTNPPTGDTYSRKYVAYARYEPTGSRFWFEYRVRHNDATDANLDPNEPAPAVGTRLPAFTVHTLSGGARLFELRGTSHELTLAIENVTDELYAEFSNATFFRPEPGRNVKASYRVRF